MDIQEYISSGIIEICVAGAATQAEYAEMERLAAAHPEIAAEIQAVQDAFEQYALAHAITPPASLKDKILGTIGGEMKAAETVTLVSENPAKAEKSTKEIPVMVATKGEKTGETSTDSGVVDITPEAKRIPFLPIFAAAATIFLVVSVYFNINLNGKLSALKVERDQLIAEKQVLADNMNKTSLQLAEARSNISLLADKKFRKITLDGVDLSPSSSAGIFYNPETGDVRLAGANLPEAPLGKQYQLWALVEGNPVDLGVFDVSSSDRLSQMKKVKSAGAFAVTLEDAGGKPVPTLDQMYLLGMV